MNFSILPVLVYVALLYSAPFNKYKCSPASYFHKDLHIIFVHSVVCSYAGGYIPDPKWVPETMDGTESYGYYVFSYIYEYIYIYI